MVKDLTHKTIVDDSTLAGLASRGLPADLPQAAARTRCRSPTDTGSPPTTARRHRPPTCCATRAGPGNQIENRYSQWVWRQYASSVWDDIRGNLGQFDDREHMAVLPYREARDEEDEKHVHPLQLDVIRRAVDLRSNPGETVLTPFMGVGSEVYAAVELGRRGIGVELKPSLLPAGGQEPGLAGGRRAA